MANSNFIGTGWTFPPEFFSPELGPKMVSMEEEIRQAIWLLITTAFGERHFHPRFGSGLSNFMFEGGSFAVLSELRLELFRVIEREETRIDLEAIELDSSESDSGLLSIDIRYTIRDTNTRSNLVFPFYLNELSNI